MSTQQLPLAVGHAKSYPMTNGTSSAGSVVSVFYGSALKMPDDVVAGSARCGLLVPDESVVGGLDHRRRVVRET